jgi:hypothetical protein
VVTATQPSSGDDTIVSVSDSADCNGGFHYGTVDLGQRGYFNGTVTFGGTIGTGLLLCNVLIQSASCSRVHWNGADALTITLGNPSAVNPSQTTSSVAVYMPDASLGFTGSISSAKQEQF